MVSVGASVADVMDQSISAGIYYIACAQFLNPTNRRRVCASGLGGHSQHAGLWSCYQPAHGVRLLAADTLCNLVAVVIPLLICLPQHHPAYSSSLLDATSPHVISYVLLHDLHIVQTAAGGRAFRYCLTSAREEVPHHMAAADCDASCSHTGRILCDVAVQVSCLRCCIVLHLTRFFCTRSCWPGST